MQPGIITIWLIAFHPIIKEKTMPTYVYLCEKCGEEFSRIMSFREYDEAKVACPKCKSKKVRQQLTDFIARTSRKS
jgi:putative FmdB family regulatory protein